MEHLALEIFDIATKENPNPTGSKYAILPDDTTITITDTNEIFASGDVWSHSFTLNMRANAHIFGTSGDIHGSRLHDQINKRKARLWAEGSPLYLGYLKLDDETEIDEDGNVDIGFESGQKTFDEMIEGINAREVSIGDIPIGIALNRRRVIVSNKPVGCDYTLDGLAAYVVKYPQLRTLLNHHFENYISNEVRLTQYVQRWPKLVISHGKVFNGSGEEEYIDYTNVQTPYDNAHPFCNVNICYQMKANKDGEEVTGRGYTLRLAHGEETTHGGDGQTRYNNAPNFYLLYFIDRLFKDMGISIMENQALDVEDLRRVFMLNYGCFYEEIEDTYKDDGSTNPHHNTPSDKLPRYGQYYMTFTDQGNVHYLSKGGSLSSPYDPDSGNRVQAGGKILLRDVEIDIDGQHILSLGSLEGKTSYVFEYNEFGDYKSSWRPELHRYRQEIENGAYSAYMAYATGDNYPNVEISSIISAMKAMFGIRLLFDSNYSSVRIILLRNIFRSNEIQEIKCDIIGDVTKTENDKRGFRMTYGKGKEDTSFYYKGFADLFTRKSKTWKDTTDRHDYSQWDLNAVYDEIKQYVSAFNKTCYVTPVTGNAYGIKVDKEESVLFPSLFGYADFMDAEDGDCSKFEEEGDTVEEIQTGADPVIMNNVGDTYASLFTGDLKAPTPMDYNNNTKTEIATFARLSNNSINIIKDGYDEVNYKVTGKLDLYACESFLIRLEDNYAVSNGGTPFDEANPGLCFGIMRSSGSDATVRYADDPEDDENDTWDILPGSNAISHQDTCDDYGNEWDYNGETTIYNSEQAIEQMPLLWPDSNISLIYVSGETYRNYQTRIAVTDCRSVTDRDGNRTQLLFAVYYGSGQQTYRGQFANYARKFNGMTKEEMFAFDAGPDGFGILIEADSSFERGYTLERLQWLAFAIHGTLTNPIRIDNGIGAGVGRFSLKLRAEKLNPYFDASLPEIVTTKKEAGIAMRKLYTSADTNLLTRPVVTNSQLRAAGWEIAGDEGNATAFSLILNVEYSDGKTHNILWTPIQENGEILSPQALQDYVDTFNGLLSNEVKQNDTLHLILDVDTTQNRKGVLYQLEALYYAGQEEEVHSVDISSVNNRYLEITNPNLRNRGLCDTFYKEYSFWVRNARIINMTVKMELAQLLTIDKTKKVKIGDITGFIRKMQYSISNETGLGKVTMEIMYI